MPFTVELLNPDIHDRRSFKNSDAAIEKFLIEKANKEHKQNLSDTYVIFHQEKMKILGYFTLSFNSILLSALPYSEAKRLPKYPTIGTVLLGRMGRDEVHTPKGFGSLILKEAMLESLKKGAFFALEVIAKNDKLTDYYKRFGFISLLDDKLHLYMTRNEIMAATQSKTTTSQKAVSMIL